MLIPGVVLSYLLGACDRSSGTGADGGDRDGGGEPRGPAFLREEADALFTLDHVPWFELDLPDGAWEQLQAVAAAEEYTVAELAFDGEPFGTVGLRFKGGDATLRRCVSGEYTCAKLGMKIRFDKYVEDQRFFGLKRLNFHSLIWDPSKLHERLGYDLYREMGVFAPRAAWGTLVINGESFGVFSMVEQVDGRFTDDRWPDRGDGNLYKESWPGYGDEDYFSEALKTNKETAVHDAVVAFSEGMVAAYGEGPDALIEELGNWTDLDYLQRYLAVDDALNNWDGVTTFYRPLDRSWTANHNYYWYQEEEADRFWLVPWDLDGVLVPAKGPVDAPHWTRVPDDCDREYAEFNNRTYVLAPGCDPVFRGLSADTGAYLSAVEELLDGPFAEEEMRSTIDALADHLALAIDEDPDEEVRAEWPGAVEALRRDIPLFRARLERLSSGGAVRPFTLARDRVNDFEDADILSVGWGVAVYPNPSSFAHRTLVSGGPPGSDQALRVDFEYRADDDGGTPYVVAYLYNGSGSTNVSDHAGVRFDARANRARPLRIELSSPAQSLAGEGIYQGWDLDADDAWQTFELPFAEASVEQWVIDEGREPDDSISDITALLRGIRFFPRCISCDPGPDVGFLEVDNVEFY